MRDVVVVPVSDTVPGMDGVAESLPLIVPLKVPLVVGVGEFDCVLDRDEERDGVVLWV